MIFDPNDLGPSERRSRKREQRERVNRELTPRMLRELIRNETNGRRV